MTMQTMKTKLGQNRMRLIRLQRKTRKMLRDVASMRESLQASSAALRRYQAAS
jgi:hypothetical protein